MIQESRLRAASAAPPLRQRLVASWGDGRYRIAFSIIVVLSIALMVIGWRTTPQVTLYQLPAWSGPIGFLLMIVAFVLFGSAKHDTVIKRFIRPCYTHILRASPRYLASKSQRR